MGKRIVHGTADDIDGRYAWTRLGVSILLATIGCAGMWIVLVVLPDVQAEFGIDRAQASLPFTAMMAFFAVGNMLAGRAVDRFGYFRPALAASLMLGAELVLAGLSATALQFTLAHGILIGLGSSALFGPLIADISHWFDMRRGVAVTAAATGNYLAGAIWPMVMPHLMTALGWRGAYIAIGAFCMAAMIPLLLLLRRRIGHGVAAASSQRLGARPALAISPRALQALLVVAGFGCCMAMSMPQVHIVAYCMDLGFGIARGSEMLALMLAGGVVSRLASGLVADRIGGIRTLLIGSVLQCVALFAYIPFDGLASLYVVSLIFGLSQGGIVPCYAIIIREYLPPAEAGQRIGMVMMATILGMSVGGWLSGWIYVQTGSYSAAFLNGIAWNMLNIAVMLWLLARHPRRMGEALA